MHKQNISITVFLATAVEMVKNSLEIFAPCLAMLDSASQLNLITNRCANFLKLTCKGALASISGIRNGNITIDKSVDIFINQVQKRKLFNIVDGDAWHY